MNYEEQIKDYLTENYYMKMTEAVKNKKRFAAKKLIKEVSKKFNIHVAEAVDNVWDWIESSFAEDDLKYFSAK